MEQSEAPKRFMTREEILRIEDGGFEPVWIPEWKTYMNVKALTARERDDYEASLVQGKGKNRDVNVRYARAKLVQRTAVEGDGKTLIFKPTDIEALGEKNAAALDRIFEVAQRLAGIAEEDLEELVGNSETGQSDDSSSV